MIWVPGNTLPSWRYEWSFGKVGRYVPEGFYATELRLGSWCVVLIPAGKVLYDDCYVVTRADLKRWLKQEED